MNGLREEVRDRLAGLDLGEAEREEVIAEIAHHFELAAAELLSNGLEPWKAQSQVLSMVGDWTELRHRIERSRVDTVKDRMKKMWLPAFGTGFVAFAAQGTIAHIVAGFLSFAAQGIMARVGLMPRMVRFHEMYMVLNVPWLLFLLVCGALGAFWSRSMGGRMRERLVAALAPAGVMGALFLFALLADFAVQVFVDHRISLQRMFFGFAVWTAWMVVLPAIPLLIGAAPFLREARAPHLDDRLPA